MTGQKRQAAKEAAELVEPRTFRIPTKLIEIVKVGNSLA